VAEPTVASRAKVIALVCSAGGVEALFAVLEPLPADLPAAVIALQHLPPDRESHLAEVLARRCALPVAVVHDGDVLESAHVYVVPPGRHAIATNDDTVRLILSGAAPPYRPSADLLLTSLAVTAGPRAIAVVLSGSGSDGATGATAIHDFGGVVIAADRESSAHFAMPEAAIGRDDAVDYVLPVDDIPGRLVELVDRHLAAR
jgi:two-component system chemotaxis response regulator CheB